MSRNRRIYKEPDLSPVGWYIASYVVRFVYLDEDDNERFDKEFLTWENTILVKGRNPGLIKNVIDNC